MSIKTRLILSFAFMIGLTLFMGGVQLLGYIALSQRYKAINVEQKYLVWAKSLEEALVKEERSLDGLVLGLESERELYVEQFAETRKIFDEGAAIFSENPADSFWPALLSEREQISPQVLELIRPENELNRSHAAVIAETILHPAYSSLRQKTHVYVEQKTLRSQNLWQDTENITLKIRRLSVGLLIGVALCGGVFAWMNYRSVSRPLSVLKDGVKAMSEGSYDIQLQIDSPQELANLARAFEEMAHSIKDLQIKLIQMSRMSAVGTLAGGVAHEINNPLTGVLGQAQILLELLAPDSPHRSSVEKIERAALRCKKIVRGLLDFSRPEEFHFESVSVHDLIANAFSLCETEIRAALIEVNWKKIELPPVKASPRHLEQVFLNLFTNAMHSMAQGGKLTIETFLRGTFVDVEVTDTGAGIHPEHLSHLFDPFFTTKEPGKGTGLGLSISYGILEQHGGKITARSAGLGEGATFVVSIPLSGK